MVDEIMITHEHRCSSVMLSMMMMMKHIPMDVLSLKDSRQYYVPGPELADLDWQL